MVIVLKKEVFNELKKELQYIGLLFLIILIMFKIVFFKENFIVLLRLVFSLFWLFVLPGYFLMFYWKEKLNFIERFVIGIALSVAIIGTFSYYLGLFGLHIKFQTILLPLVLIIAGFIFSMRK
jgi:uncharacterized membrane protein